MAKATHKLLTFDIDTKVASAILGEQNYRVAYKMIEAHMLDNDFKHTEGSAYLSKRPISYPQMNLLIKKLKRKYPFLDKVIRHSTVASVSSKVYNANPLSKYDGTAGEYAGLYLRNSEVFKIKHDAALHH